MKSTHIYILSVLAFFLVMFVVECNLPKKLVWIPTYAHTDHQPFGCAVFDDLLASSFTEEYTLSNQTIYQLSEDSTARFNLLVIADQIQLSDADLDVLITRVERGSKVLLAASGYNKKMCDTLGFKIHDQYFTPRMLKKYVSKTSLRDTVYGLPDLSYPLASYAFYPHLCQDYFIRYDSLNTAFAVAKPHESGVTIGQFLTESAKDSIEVDSLVAPFRVIAMKQQRGKGEITLVSTPLLFTNYGVLDEGNAAFLFRLLNTLQGAPLVRTEAYGASAGLDAEQQTPLRYMLSEQPLRWALYSLLLLILLFMIFTARRRQRVIPVVRPPENKTIEFISLIGTLYHQRKDHTDLLRKKYMYFADRLRRSIQVDIEEDVSDECLARRIADKTGADRLQIERLLKGLRPIVYEGRAADEEKMQLLIDEINKIIKYI